MTGIARRLADLMLDLRTFEFRPDDPVRWASGYVMPVYNDNRRLMSFPEARSLVSQGFAELVADATDPVGGVVGTATAGIAPATLLADRLGTRLYYVRSAEKSHGLRRRVEGADSSDSGRRVVLVEDVVSTGGSVARAAEATHDSGLVLTSGLAVFSYGFEMARSRLAALPFPFEVHSLVTVQDLLSRALVHDRLGRRDHARIIRWLEDPLTWGESMEAGR